MTTAAVLIGVALAGTAVSTYAAYSAAQAQKSAYSYNSKLASEEQGAAQTQGNLAAQQDARQQALAAGAIEANQGASGGTQQGSALDVLGDVNSQWQKQKQDDVYNAQLRAFGYQSASTAASNAANASSPGLAAAGALGQGASNTAMLYSRLYPQQEGAPVANV